MVSRPCSVCFVLPPHILERIAQNGSPSQQRTAVRSLLQSERIRGQRDAISESLALSSVPTGERRRTLYNARHDTTLPGQRMRGEGEPLTGDPSADEAFEGAGATYDLYHEVYGRSGLDDRGMRLDASVHYSEGFDNAFWNGTQMVYGDGDENRPEEERLFNRFTCAVDIIGHELTHGVTQYEANLVYYHQSGALNESFSDVMGSMVKQRLLGQKADEADWLIGAGLLTSNVKGVAIRSMKAPGTAYDDPVLGRDPQPAHMEQYDHMPIWQDNGGVHINSGIPNRAFYVAAMEIGGAAWERAGRIWYYTLRDRLRRTSTFQDAAHRTWQVAGELFGEKSREQVAVHTGWDAVGIDSRRMSINPIGIR